MLLSEVDAHRSEVEGITTLAGKDLEAYGTTVLNESPVKASGQLRAATNAVIGTYAETAAVSGALFYETHRPKPGFTADLVTPSIGEKVASEIGWALVPFFKPERFELAQGEAINRLLGVTQKYVANADRLTVQGAGKKDPTSTGVRWYANADACAFCALMSASESRTTDAHWHGNCKCVMIPGWDDSPIPDAEYMDEYGRAAERAQSVLSNARMRHPDWQAMSPRQFLRAHPEYAITNKNLTRVMRERFGFTH